MSGMSGERSPKVLRVSVYRVDDTPGKQFEVDWTDENDESWSVECDDLADVQQMIDNLLSTTLLPPEP